LKILVTGGAGFIGSVLVSELLSEGHEVTVLDNLMWGMRGLSANLGKRGFTFVKGDLTDDSLIPTVLKGKEVVVNLAALVGCGLCEAKKKQATDVNVNGSRNLAKHLSDEQLLIYASTGSVYGSLKGECCTEKTPPTPQTHYAVTKFQAEKIFLERTNTVVLRFATAFGVSSRIRLDLLVNQFVYEAVKNKSLVVFGKNTPRSFVHVKDVARSVTFAIQNSESMRGQVFNVGSSGLPLTKEQIAQHVRNHVDFDLKFSGSDVCLNGKDYYFSTKKIEAFGYHPQVSLDEGITELINAFENLEVDQNCFNT